MFYPPPYCAPYVLFHSRLLTAERVAPACGEEKENGSRREASKDGEDRPTTASGARNLVLEVDR